MVDTATAPTRTPDDQINVRDVIDANWDSETPGTEPWKITRTLPDGTTEVVVEGHDLELAQRLGYHRLGQAVKDEASNSAQSAAQTQAEADDRAAFEAWRTNRQTTTLNEPGPIGTAQQQAQQQEQDKAASTAGPDAFVRSDLTPDEQKEYDEWKASRGA